MTGAGRSSDYARADADLARLRGAGGAADHVIRYLPRDYELFARLNAGDQYPEAWQHATNMLGERIAELRRQGVVIREGSAEYERLT